MLFIMKLFERELQLKCICRSPGDFTGLHPVHAQTLLNFIIVPLEITIVIAIIIMYFDIVF